MIINIFKLLRSGPVRRWHANPDMAHCGENNAEHQWSTAMIALYLDPNLSRETLIYALTHDVGEVGVGDLPGDIKDKHATLREIHKRIEATSRASMIRSTIASPELNLVTLADKLSANLAVMRNNPRLAQSDYWVLSRDRLRCECDGAAGKLLDEWYDYYVG